jgi:hypothetical protein
LDSNETSLAQLDESERAKREREKKRTRFKARAKLLDREIQRQYIEQWVGTKNKLAASESGDSEKKEQTEVNNEVPYVEKGNTEDTLLNDYIDYEVSGNELNDEENNAPIGSPKKESNLENSDLTETTTTTMPVVMDIWLADLKKNEKIEHAGEQVETTMTRSAKKSKKRAAENRKQSAWARKISDRFETKPIVDAELHWKARENRMMSRSFVEASSSSSSLFRTVPATHRSYNLEIYGKESGYSSLPLLRREDHIIKEGDPGEEGVNDYGYFNYLNMNNLIPEDQEYTDYYTHSSLIGSLNANQFTTNTATVNYDNPTTGYENSLDSSFKNESNANGPSILSNDRFKLKRRNSVKKNPIDFRDSNSRFHRTFSRASQVKPPIPSPNTNLMAYLKFNQKHMLRQQQKQQQQPFPNQISHDKNIFSISSDNVSQNTGFKNGVVYDSSPRNAMAPAMAATAVPVVVKPKLEPLMPSTNIVHHRELDHSSGFTARPDRQTGSRLERIFNKPTTTRIPRFQFSRANEQNSSKFQTNQSADRSVNNSSVNSKTKLEPLEYKTTAAPTKAESNATLSTKIPSLVTNKVAFSDNVKS